MLNDGQHVKAMALGREAVETARRLGDDHLLASSLINHGIYLWYGGGDHPQVFANYDEALAIMRTLMAGKFKTYAPTFISWAGWPVGPQLLADGQADKAAALAAEAETYQRQLAAG